MFSSVTLLAVTFNLPSYNEKEIKIVVFRATGGTGIEIVNQALDRAHEVTAIVRNPDAMKESHVRLHVVKGDAMVPDSFAEALKNQDAVLSAIGISSFWQSLKPTTFHRRKK